MLLKTALGAAGLAVVMMSAQAASAAPLLSDNFDSATQGLNWAGDATFTSTGAPGSVDLIGTGFYDLYSGHGNYVDLDGTTGGGNNPAGQLTSTASFGPGSYSLSFLLGGNARGAAAQTTTISLGDFTTSINLASGDPLKLYTFNFTTGTGGALVFTEQGPSDQQGNILDNVSLSSAVPEPGVWALMLTGFGLMGATVRRRRALHAG